MVEGAVILGRGGTPGGGVLSVVERSVVTFGIYMILGHFCP